MKKILILSANPRNTTSLRLDEEVREIEEALDRSKNREQFQLITKGAVRVDDLRRVLLSQEPQIVHFSGHGAGDDGIVLENSSGDVQLVSTEALTSLFKLFKDKVECVLLNACYSEVQSNAIHEYIDCVIGMGNPIEDQIAINFSKGFYDAIYAGKDYTNAFEFGRNSIDLNNIPICSIPIIKTRHRSKVDQGAQGIKYSKLRDFLANEQWKDADNETEMLILEAAERKGQLVNVESIQKLPITDLCTIDELWRRSSRGHFGFSVQKQIWEENKKKTDNEYTLYCLFGDRVGWRKDGQWLWYKDMTFNLSAPKGHFPQRGLEAVLLGKTIQWKFNESRMSLGLGEKLFSEFFYRVSMCKL